MGSHFWYICIRDQFWYEMLLQKKTCNFLSSIKKKNTTHQQKDPLRRSEKHYTHNQLFPFNNETNFPKKKQYKHLHDTIFFLRWRRIFLRLFFKRKRLQIQRNVWIYGTITNSSALFLSSGTASNEIRGCVCIRAKVWSRLMAREIITSWEWEIFCVSRMHLYISPCCFSHRGKYKGRPF